MKPGAVAGDAHLAVPAALRIPLVDRRQPALVDQSLELGQADAVQFDGGAALGHFASLLRRACDDNRAPMQDQSRTAIVTGAGKRVGAAIAAALVADGWAVVAHVHHADDEIPDGATKVVAELTDLACADTIFEATAGLPPVGLLVNNAAHFAHDDLSEFDPAELAAHMAGQSARTGPFDGRVRALSCGRFEWTNRQLAGFQARRAQPRFSQLHLVEAGPGRIHRTGSEGSRD